MAWMLVNHLEALSNKSEGLVSLSSTRYMLFAVIVKDRRSRPDGMYRFQEGQPSRMVSQRALRMSVAGLRGLAGTSIPAETAKRV